MSHKPSFFSELKRRHVDKVALVYVVVSWLLIEAASILLPMLDAPAWVMTGVDRVARARFHSCRNHLVVL